MCPLTFRHFQLLAWFILTQKMYERKCLIYRYYPLFNWIVPWDLAYYLTDDSVVLVKIKANLWQPRPKMIAAVNFSYWWDVFYTWLNTELCMTFSKYAEKGLLFSKLLFYKFNLYCFTYLMIALPSFFFSIYFRSSQIPRYWIETF